MEKESELFQTSINILHNMDASDFKQIKSGTGLVDLSCTIIEESYIRLKKLSSKNNKEICKISGSEKKETAVLLLTPLMEKLKEKKIIDDNLQNILIDFLSRESIEDTIDDLIGTWKDNLENIHYTCMTIMNLFASKRKNRTRLSSVKIELE